MAGIKYTNQIDMAVPPTEDKHVIRKIEQEEALANERLWANSTFIKHQGLLPVSDPTSMMNTIITLFVGVQDKKIIGRFTIANMQSFEDSPIRDRSTSALIEAYSGSNNIKVIVYESGSSSNAIFYRDIVNLNTEPGWSGIWRTLAIKEEMMNSIAIPSNSDLDDYKQPGFYTANTVNIARTILNSPTENIFTLKVLTTTTSSSARVSQVLQDAYGMWLRWYQYSPAEWTEWQQIATQDWVTETFAQKEALDEKQNVPISLTYDALNDYNSFLEFVREIPAGVYHLPDSSTVPSGSWADRPRDNWRGERNIIVIDKVLYEDAEEIEGVVTVTPTTGNYPIMTRSWYDGGWTRPWTEIGGERDGDTFTVVPDYANADTSSRIAYPTTTWTAHADGFIGVGGRTTNGGIVRVRVNGSQYIVATYTDSSVVQTGSLQLLPIRMGDFVEIFNQGGGGLAAVTILFIPPRYIWTTTPATPFNARLIGQPDYSKQETTNRITANNGSWTVDRDGYVICRFGVMSSNGGTGELRVNNVPVWRGEGDKIGTNYITIPVSKGDIVTMSLSGDVILNPAGWRCYFIPPVSTAPQFITGADLQKGTQSGEVTWDSVTKIMSVINGATKDWAVGKAPIVMSPSDSSVLDYADTFPIGFHLFVNSSTTGHDAPLPASGFRYILYKHSAILGTLLAFTTPSSGSSNRVFFNSRNQAGWIGWQEVATHETALITNQRITDFDAPIQKLGCHVYSINDNSINTPLDLASARFNQGIVIDNTINASLLHGTRCVITGAYIFVRTLTNSVWSDWRLTAQNAAIRLSQGTDFNDVRAGKYYVNNAADAATMLNLPVSDMAGVLDATSIDTDGGLARQQIYSTFSGSAVYMRGYSGSPLAWSAWRRIDRPNYSTSEHLTGEMWIDGKPIYRRVLQGTSGVATTGNPAVATLPVGATIGTLVSVAGYIQLADGRFVAAQYANTQSEAMIAIQTSTNRANMEVRTYSTTGTYDSRPLTVIVEYTRAN